MVPKAQFSFMLSTSPELEKSSFRDPKETLLPFGIFIVPKAHEEEILTFLFLGILTVNEPKAQSRSKLPTISLSTFIILSPKTIDCLLPEELLTVVLVVEPNDENNMFIPKIIISMPNTNLNVLSWNEGITAFSSSNIPIMINPAANIIGKLIFKNTTSL